MCFSCILTNSSTVKAALHGKSTNKVFDTCNVQQITYVQYHVTIEKLDYEEQI